MVTMLKDCMVDDLNLSGRDTSEVENMEQMFSKFGGRRGFRFVLF